jgi:hypothetical protein
MHITPAGSAMPTSALHVNPGGFDAPDPCLHIEASQSRVAGIASSLPQESHVSGTPVACSSSLVYDSAHTPDGKLCQRSSRDESAARSAVADAVQLMYLPRKSSGGATAAAILELLQCSRSSEASHGPDAAAGLSASPSRGTDDGAIIAQTILSQHACFRQLSDALPGRGSTVSNALQVDTTLTVPLAPFGIVNDAGSHECSDNAQQQIAQDLSVTERTGGLQLTSAMSKGAACEHTRTSALSNPDEHLASCSRQAYPNQAGQDHVCTRNADNAHDPQGTLTSHLPKGSQVPKEMSTPGHTTNAIALLSVPWDHAADYGAHLASNYQPSLQMTDASTCVQVCQTTSSGMAGADGHCHGEMRLQRHQHHEANSRGASTTANCDTHESHMEPACAITSHCAAVIHDRVFAEEQHVPRDQQQLPVCTHTRTAGLMPFTRCYPGQ